MSKRFDPEQVRYPSGPYCGDCPYRTTSRGFAPPQGFEYLYDEATKTWLKYQPGPLWLTAEYLFQAEGLGKDEAKQGLNLVGGTGGIFNMLLHNNTPLHRTTVAITNTVHCRPIKHLDGKPIVQPHGDYVNDKPSPGQIRACFERYGRKEISSFQGGTIVGLGASTLSLYAGQPRTIKKHAGTIYERGELQECLQCAGTGGLDRPRQKCPDCTGKGVGKCIECHRFKPTKKCTTPHIVCTRCAGSGLLERPRRVCPGCGGMCHIPSDPDNPYTSALLGEGQIFFATYHPAFLMRSPNEKRTLEQHFRRITGLRNELEIENTTEYSVTPTSAQLEDVFRGNRVSVDLETSALYPERGEIQMVGASTKVGTAICANGDSRHAFELLKRAHTDPSIVIVGQNWMQFDAYWIWKKWRIGPPAACFDTLLVGHLLSPDAPKNLVALSQEYAKPPIRGYWKTRENYRSNKQLVAMIDVDATLRVADGQEEALAKAGMEREYWGEVYPTMQVAFDMRATGWRVKRAALAKANRKVQSSVERLRSDLPEWPGIGKTTVRTENQSEHVRDYLYRVLRLPIQLDPGSHQPSAGWEQLTELETRLKTGHHSVEHLTTEELGEALRFIPLVMELRDSSKLLSFLNPDSEFLSRRDRFHATWNPAGTATFRFSCSEPNLQQVPKCKCKPECFGDNPECENARFPFVGDGDEWVVGSTDYSQIEVIGFLWAAEQWDVLKKVLLEGLDAHAVMGNLMGMERSDAKHMTFALVYGAADDTIAAKSGKSLEVVAQAREHYLETFKGVKEFRWNYIQHAMRYGYVENPFGRRRYIWVDKPMGRAANQAANAPVQGIPPMVVRRAMVQLHKELPSPARILGNIHDEIIWTCPKYMLKNVTKCIVDVMKSPIPEMPAHPLGMGGGLILNVDVETGPDWSRLKK